MRILWIGKQPTTGQGGDEVFDRKAIKACRDLGHSVDLFHPQRVGRLAEALNLLKGLPHYRAKFSSAENFAGVRQSLAGHDVVVCSWEPFDLLAGQLKVPVVMVLHNITSRSLPAIFPRSALASFAARRARSWEKNNYRANPRSAIAVLSRRDQAYIEALDNPPMVVLLPPGMPPAVSLATDANLARELVISGTFDWLPKKRDVLRFAKEYASLDDRLPIRADQLPSEACARINLFPLPQEAENRTAIRFGVVTDRFESGHKLKTLSYIANNQIVLSFSDVSFDFDEIPDNDLFIRRVRSVEEMTVVIRSFEAMPLEDLRNRFLQFKQRCATHFTWNAVAEGLMRTAKILTERNSRASSGSELPKTFAHRSALASSF